MPAAKHKSKRDQILDTPHGWTRDKNMRNYQIRLQRKKADFDKSGGRLLSRSDGDIESPRPKVQSHPSMEMVRDDEDVRGESSMFFPAVSDSDTAMSKTPFTSLLDLTNTDIQDDDVWYFTRVGFDATRCNSTNARVSR